MNDPILREDSGNGWPHTVATRQRLSTSPVCLPHTQGFSRFAQTRFRTHLDDYRIGTHIAKIEHAIALLRLHTTIGLALFGKRSQKQEAENKYRSDRQKPFHSNLLRTLPTGDFGIDSTNS